MRSIEPANRQNALVPRDHIICVIGAVVVDYEEFPFELRRDLQVAHSSERQVEQLGPVPGADRGGQTHVG